MNMKKAEFSTQLSLYRSIKTAIPHPFCNEIR